MKKVCLLLFVLFASVLSVFSEDSSVNQGDRTPVPYEKGEFSSALLDFRRNEIVTIGSYPLTTMAFGTGYSLYRYFLNDRNPDYFPRPFSKNYSAAPLSSDEQKLVLLGAAGLSIGIGIADFIVTQVLEAAEYKKREETLSQNALDPDIKIIPVYASQSNSNAAAAQNGSIDTNN